ncbi:MAG: efflux RND transporter periplasmic adaptor subunit [Gammaproteobacteria bacterium]|nr:MAG: efflux RND transporter periplasmic adaptor subunit [Gammaproteobacteria bacterium]
MRLKAATSPSLLVTLVLAALPLLTKAEPPVPVFVQAAAVEPFSEKIEALGTLRANEAVTLSATVTETITSIHFNDGQRVEAGKVLVEMTSAEEHAQLEQARSTLREAQRQYQRIKGLVKTNLASESLLDERLAAYETAQAQLQATQSRLQDRLVIAPFDGVVGLRQISVGALVTPGDTITTLDDDSIMKLDMSVPAVFLDSLRPGLQVIANSRELGGQHFEGEITSLDSRVDPITRSITVRALLPNDGRHLKPGMLMTVALQKPPVNYLMIPEEALVREGFNQYAFVVNQSTEPPTVSKRQLSTGPRRPGAVAVTAGIAPGELVVTHGVMRLTQGSPVSITATQKGGESLNELLKQSSVGSGAH